MHIGPYRGDSGSQSVGQWPLGPLGNKTWAILLKAQEWVSKSTAAIINSTLLSGPDSSHILPSPYMDTSRPITTSPAVFSYLLHHIPYAGWWKDWGGANSLVQICDTQIQHRQAWTNSSVRIGLSIVQHKLYGGSYIQSLISPCWAERISYMRLLFKPDRLRTTLHINQVPILLKNGE